MFVDSLGVSVFCKCKSDIVKKPKIGAVISVSPLVAVTDPCCVDKCLYRFYPCKCDTGRYVE